LSDSSLLGSLAPGKRGEAESVNLTFARTRLVGTEGLCSMHF
jgi:hypothetical protein